MDEQIIKLGEDYSASLKDNLKDTLVNLKKTDRITDLLMESLTDWLQRLESDISKEQLHHVEELIFAVNRQKNFRAAKKLVRKRLPHFYFIDKRDDVQKVSDLPLLEEQRGNSPPVLLIDEHTFKLTPKEKDKLRYNAAELSESCQILYVLKGKPSTLPANSRVVTSADFEV